MSKAKVVSAPVTGPKRGKPRFTLRCPASRSDGPDATTIELVFPDGSGCLIHASVGESTNRLDVYRCDPCVSVIAPGTNPGDPPEMSLLRTSCCRECSMSVEERDLCVEPIHPASDLESAEFDPKACAYLETLQQYAGTMVENDLNLLMDYLTAGAKHDANVAAERYQVLLTELDRKANGGVHAQGDRATKLREKCVASFKALDAIAKEMSRRGVSLPPRHWRPEEPKAG